MISMGKLKLKVCGMRDPENIREIAALDPDYMGFIFYKESKRFVGDGFMAPPDLGRDIKRVGVFVNSSTEDLLSLIDRHRLDLVQLHGTESVDQCREVHTKGVGTIKAFAVDENFDFDRLGPYKEAVDYFLFDTKGPDFGGNGRVFDWRILKRYDQQTPFFLSGGISPLQVEGLKLVQGMNIHALDVNSRMEESTGIKSKVLVEKMIESLSLTL